MNTQQGKSIIQNSEEIMFPRQGKSKGAYHQQTRII